MHANRVNRLGSRLMKVFTRRIERAKLSGYALFPH